MSDNNMILSMPRRDYDRLDRVNWSKLKLLRRSPAHYRHNTMHPQKETAALKNGRAVHLAVFEPELFLSEVAVWDGGRRYGKEWDKFQADHVGMDIITEEEHAECLAISSAVRQHPVAAKYLTGGRAEQTILWTHREPEIGTRPEFKEWDKFQADHVGMRPEFETACKGRVDFIANCGAIVDLKTTTDASPDGFGRQCWRYQYHAQAAFYSDAVKAATGHELPYVLVATEKEPPYVTQVYRVPEIILDLGREEYRRLLSLLKLCREESKWDGYSDGELELTLPKWAVDFGDDEDVSGMDLVFSEVA